MARERDRRAMEAWGEHPYVDVVDNRADFETKVIKLVVFYKKKSHINYQTQKCNSLLPILQSPKKNIKIRPLPMKITNTWT